MADALKDGNFVSTIIVESSTNAGVIVRLKGEQATGALLVKVVA